METLGGSVSERLAFIPSLVSGDALTSERHLMRSVLADEQQHVEARDDEADDHEQQLEPAAVRVSTHDLLR